jgi:protein gp37
VADQSTIEWTDTTWNPVAGCKMASAGCTNCYAMRLAARLEAMGLEKYRGLTRKSGGRHVWTGSVRCDEASLRLPSKWRRPRKIFVNSMSDLFHEDVPLSFISQVWFAMAATPRHIFQILTKRPGRMLAMASSLPVLPNVWLGTSVEDSQVLPRIDELRQMPAAVRFISFEPLIGSVAAANLDQIHWAIVGGESGPAHRPMESDWVRQIRDICRRDGTAFFFKQWGGPRPKSNGRTLDGSTWDEYPTFAGSLASVGLHVEQQQGSGRRAVG